MYATGIQAFDTLNFSKVLEFHNITGQKYNYQGFPELHNLYLINKVFSANPWGEIVDRSGKTAYPFRLHIRCPWYGPTKSISLAQTCAETVQSITALYSAPYYVFWSGGIDSTLALVSLLKTVNHKDIVVVCNKFSIAEAPNFYNDQIDGKLRVHDSLIELPQGCTAITGEVGDIVWGILDDGFMNDPEVVQYLYRPWQEYFEIKNANLDFLHFVDQFMQSSQRPIDTLLEARWWFYFLTKGQSKAVQKFLKLDWPVLKYNLVHFYENTFFDNWSYYNTDKFIKGFEWKTYKMPAKQIIYEYHNDRDYLLHKTKGYSNSMEKITMSDLTAYAFNRPLFITDTYEKPESDTEPFFSTNLYRQQHYAKYKHLFGQ